MYVSDDILFKLHSTRLSRDSLVLFYPLLSSKSVTHSLTHSPLSQLPAIAKHHNHNPEAAMPPTQVPKARGPSVRARVPLPDDRSIRGVCFERQEMLAMELLIYLLTYLPMNMMMRMMPLMAWAAKLVMDPIRNAIRKVKYLVVFPVISEVCIR